MRAIRPRSAPEQAFLELGAAAEDFLRAAAAAGTPRLAAEIAAINELAAAWGSDTVSAAITRALEFRRFAAADIASILEAGGGLPSPVAAGVSLSVEVPNVPMRGLSDYSLKVLG